MDCNNSQSNTCTCRPQMPVPPCMNTNCSCACNGGQNIQPRPIRPIQPAAPAFRTSVCEDQITGMPIAMAYVPWQKWKQTYSLEQGISRGTIFPELDLPFVMGRCR